MAGSNEGKTYIVIGCGYFGCRAVQALKRLPLNSLVIAVDRDEGRLLSVKATADRIHHGDGVQFFAKLTGPQAAAWWIVPALPLHLAADWLLQVFNETEGVERARKLPVPADFDPKGTLQHRTPGGTLYCSLGNLVCPEDCPEPEGYCHATGQLRPAPLYRILAETPCPGYRSLVLRSRLIVPGVGGYPFADLLALQTELTGSVGSYLISTACTCHAVTDAISLSSLTNT
ncbi:MAG: hypothetical protein AB1796_03500 [Bacillota bacterium]